MNKIYKTLVSVGFLGALALGGSPLVSAEEGDSLNSKIDFRFGGELKIKEAPSFDFGRVEYEGKAKTVNLPETKNLVVSDETGLGDSWTVAVSFTGTQVFNRESLRLKLENTALDSRTQSSGSVTLEGNESSVIKASTLPSYNRDIAEYTFEYSAGDKNQLLIPDNANTGSFSTVINWNLQSTP